MRRIFGKKRRKYPIKRDEDGKSLRERCFELFDEGIRPKMAASYLDMKEATAFRYFQQWQKIGANFNKKFSNMKKILDVSNEDRPMMVEIFSKHYGISVEEFEAILKQPHGLRRLMQEKLDIPKDVRERKNLSIAYHLGFVIADFLEESDSRVEDVSRTFDYFLRWYKERRLEYYDDIKEENQSVAFMRDVLHLAEELEWDTIPTIDKFTPEEQMKALGIVAKQKLKQMSYQYFGEIYRLVKAGYTEEDAREKLYQEYLDKGDETGAEAMRKLQNIIHPLKTEKENDQ